MTEHRVDAKVKVCRIEGTRTTKIADLAFGCEGTDPLGALVATLQCIDPADSSDRLQQMVGDRMLGDLFRRGNRLREVLSREVADSQARVWELCERLFHAGATAHARSDPQREDWHHIEVMARRENPFGAPEGHWSFCVGLPDASLRDERFRVREPLNEQLGTKLLAAQRRVENAWRRRCRVRALLERELDRCLLGGF